MKKVYFATFITSFVIFLVSLNLEISSAQQIGINCNPCYVSNCQCNVNCSDGKMNVFTSVGCQNDARYVVDVTNGNVSFFPIQPGQFFARINCNDNGQISSCQAINVASYPGQTDTATATPTATTTITPPTQTTTMITTTAAGQTQTTGNTETTSITSITTTRTINSNNNSQAQSSSSLSSILTVTIGIAIGVIGGILVIHLLSRRSGQDQFESLKQKWGR